MKYNKYIIEIDKGLRRKIHLLITGLYIGPGSFGGIVNFNRVFLKYINSKAFEFHFFSLGKNPNWYKGSEKVIKYKYYLSLFPTVIKYIYLIFKKRIDVVHINSGLSSRELLRDGFLSLIALILGSKSCFVIHGWKENVFLNIKKKYIKRKLISLLLKAQNCIGVCSPEYKIKLENLGITSEKIFIFTNMVETNSYLNKKVSTPKSINLLFCAQPLKKEKGINEFLDSIPAIVLHFQECKFTIIGGGKKLNLFINRSKKLKIENHIEFVGYVSLQEKIKIFQKSDILIFPSYTEGFPKTILEAMASGMAVITTPVGGLATEIIEERNGLVIKSMPPNPTEIASLVCQLLDNVDLLNRIKENNILDVNSKFEAGVVSRKFEEKYCMIIE